MTYEHRNAHKISTFILLIAIIVGAFFLGRSKAPTIYKEMKEIEVCKKNDHERDTEAAFKVCPNGVLNFQYEYISGHGVEPQFSCK
jgi:hypothetical protein